MFKNHDPIIHSTRESDIPTITRHMNQYGYAVVRIPSIDTNYLKNLFARDMGHITDEFVPFPDLWNSNICEVPNSGHPGLLGEYGLAQGEAAWHVRTNPEIIGIFKALLDAKDVVCSMDAIGFSQDGAFLGASNSSWLHVDQNPNVLPGGDLTSIQGIFYAENSTEGGSDTGSERRAGTVVVPGSHLDWNKHNYTSKGHFQVVDQKKYVYQAVKLNIPAGCLLLFSSKLVHQGMYGEHRLCFMVSYGDRNDRTEEVRRRKVMMYLGGHRSSHWSQYGIYHGWKWQHGAEWEILIPKIIGSFEDHIDLVEDERTDPHSYEPELDSYIPANRLKLL